MKKVISALLIAAVSYLPAQEVWKAAGKDDWHLRKPAAGANGIFSHKSGQRMIAAKSFKTVPGKKYIVSGEFRLVNAAAPSPLYFGVVSYTADGREIEFVYKGRECAITNHTSRWWFYDGVDQVEVCEFRSFELLVSKVAEYRVDDRRVQDIFDKCLYEKVSIL